MNFKASRNYSHIKYISSLFFLLLFSIQFVNAQDHPGTGGATCGFCAPAGWTNLTGSPDISDVDQWPISGAWEGAPLPAVPNGETSFLTAHSGESSSMQITGLTIGESYTLEFYYSTAKPVSPLLIYGSIIAPAFQYSINGDPIISKPIAAVNTWYKENVVFTATATTSTFVFHGGGSTTDGGDLTNVSFIPNGTVPAVPVCPTIDATVPFFSTICSGESITITATGGPSGPDWNYSWTDVTSAPVGTGTSITVSPADTTSFQLRIDSANCNRTFQTPVLVIPNPTVTVNSASICSGQTATLTASGGTDYTWSPATDLSGTTGTSVISSSTSNITYTVSSTTDGCTGSAEATVTIGSSATPNAGENISICSGVPGNLGAAAVAGYDYSWSPTTGLSSSTISNPTVTSTNTTTSDIITTYTLTAGPAGCTSTDEVVVTILADEDASFSYTPSTVCKTGGADPTPVVAGTAGGSYTGTTGLTINPTTGVVGLAATAIGTYTVTYTSPGACSSSSEYVISIVNIPDATFSYAGPYCQSAPNPSPTFPDGSSAGIFSSAGGLSFANTGTGEVDLLTSTPGTYTVTNTIAAGGGCSAATAENTITVNAAPLTIVDNPSVCGGNPASLTASGATSYSWSTGASGSTIVVSPVATTSYTVTGSTAGCSSSAVGTVTANSTPTVTVSNAAVCDGAEATLTASGAASYSWSNGSSTASLTATPTNTTSYTVTGTSNGCSSSAEGTITVSASPNVVALDASVCGGLPATISANGADTYLWNTGATTQSITVSPSSTTQYTVTGTTAGCTGTATPSVTVSPTPTVTVTGMGTICAGAPATATASGADSYVWSTGALTATLNVNPTASTTYTVTGTSAGCTDVQTVSVQVNPVPNVTVTNDIICSGKTATLTASGATSYVWTPSIGGGTGASVSGSPTTTTNYTVTGTSLSCSATAFASITVQSTPTVTATSDTVCPGETATITANGGDTYLWSNGSTSPSINVSPSENTVYSVTGTQGGCSQTANATVFVSPQPDASFTFSPDPAGVLNPAISFYDQSSSDVTSWNWNFSNNDSVAENSPNPIHTYPAIEESYIVTLNVRNNGGCVDTVRRTVVVGPEYTFFVPNAFSPNDDGFNDGFAAKGDGIIDYKMFVFDRWGNSLFYTSDLDTEWNGNFQGAICQEDVYVWRVELIDVFKKEHSYTGIVSLVK